VELTKAKKTLREKEKELVKMKQELANFKTTKLTANSENTVVALA
jgi:ribosomal protein L29